MSEPSTLAAVLAEAVEHHRAGRLGEAIANYRAVLVVSPDAAQIHNNLGVALRDLGRLDEAVLSYRRALELQPDFAEVYSNLGTALRDLGRLDESAACHRRSIELKPTFASAHNNLGNTLRDLGRLDEAEASVRRALAIVSDYPQAYHNLGNVLRELGRADEAAACLERAIASSRTASDLAALHKNLLMTLMYHPSIDDETLVNAHLRFDAVSGRPLAAKAKPHVNAPDADRPLRIGYLSSDLRSHPVARNLLPVVRSHDRKNFELYFYAEVAKPDAVTEDFKSLATGWRSTVGFGDEQVAEQIRGDGIDILVCLAGRFDKNRPLVCAFKPAPIQIGYHDVATSGLSAVDYLFSDRVLTPRRGRERFTERLLCLPNFYIADIPADLPPIQQRGGPVVFGCLNAPAKIGDAVLDLWARLLDRIPDSRLILRYQNLYQIASLRARVDKAFRKHGIDPARIVYPAAATSSLDHLMIYNDIDIALDPFPFSGSTTTFEALLMGVPVVTLAAARMVGRWTAGMLSSLGLKDLIATSEPDYLRIAEGLAADAARRNRLRATLRDRVTTSALTDHRKKARQIERFYRAVWRIWCAARS